jgi:predicted nuclease with TOPRIM domain
MSNWLTIQESSQLVGKSVSTLRRLAKELKSKRSKAIKFQKLKTGHEQILFDSDYLTTHFNTSVNSSFNSSMNSSDDTLKLLLDTLKHELDEKNKQIQLLLDRQHEQNVILQTLQERVKQIESPKKRSWWRRKD